MKTSPEINELAAALSKAQGEVAAAHKDSSNQFFKSKYADLAAVWDACRAPLSTHGLAIVQVPRSEGGTVTMETRLVHSSGQWIEGELTATAKDDGPQSIGSVVTYLRRYMLQAMTGVAPEDDDGCEGQGQEPRAKTNGKAQQVAKQHGMKTADEMPQPGLSPAVKSAFEKLSQAVANRNDMEVAELMTKAYDRKGSGELSEEAFGQISREATLAIQKIKALENEPATA